MEKLMKTFRGFQSRLDRKAERFGIRHPYLAFVGIFVGMPVSVLAAVFLCTTAVSALVSWLMGF